MGSISPHILLLEDELTVRILMTQILANLLDAQVTAFSSAEEGIEYLKQPDTRVDLIITDIQMVGLLDGYDVARLSLQHCPSTPVVITSGLNGPERRKPPRTRRSWPSHGTSQRSRALFVRSWNEGRRAVRRSPDCNRRLLTLEVQALILGNSACRNLCFLCRRGEDEGQLSLQPLTERSQRLRALQAMLADAHERNPLPLQQGHELKTDGTHGGPRECA